MKRGIAFILCALLFAGLILAGIQSMPSIRSSTAPVEIEATKISTPHSSFLTLCSGLPVNSATVRIATANCLGRIRGFSDAHALTVKLAGDQGTSIQMWCVNPTVSDQQLLDSVIAWTTNNNARVADLTKQYTAVNAATAIIIAALHSSYPCEK